jgi:hypothetical protein
MLGSRTKLRGVVVFAVLGTGVAAAMVSGCGDDSTGPAPGDAQVDSTQPDASQPDVGVPDVASEAAPPDATLDGTPADATSADVTQSDASHDAAQDVSHTDGSPLDAAPGDAQPDASDAGPDATSADGAALDAADASADAPSEAGSPGDASEGGGCTTTIGLFDDSGTAQLLFGFDSPTDINTFTAYTFPASASTDTLTQSPTEGAPIGCPGAAALNLTYSAYGVQSGIDYDFPTLQDWTGRVRLHMWIKLVTSDYTTINGVQPIAFSETAPNTTFLDQFGQFLAGSAFAGGTWVELVTDVSTANANFVPTAVTGFEIRLTTVSTMADGGPAAPPSATLLVDDIWLE